MVRVTMVVWFGVSTNVYVVVVVLQYEGEQLLNVETTAFHLQCKLFSIRIFEYIKCFFAPYTSLVCPILVFQLFQYVLILDLEKTVHVTEMRRINNDFLSMTSRNMLMTSVDETVTLELVRTLQFFIDARLCYTSSTQ